MTPCRATQEAVKDCVVKCKSPFVSQFKWEFPQNVQLKEQFSPVKICRWKQEYEILVCVCVITLSSEWMDAIWCVAGV